MEDIEYSVARLVDWIAGIRAGHDLNVAGEPLVEPAAVDHHAGTVDFVISADSGYVPLQFRVTVEKVS